MKADNITYSKISQPKFITHIKEVFHDLKERITSTKNTNYTMLTEFSRKIGQSTLYVNLENEKIQSGDNNTVKSRYYEYLGNNQIQPDTDLTKFIQNTKNNEFLIKDTIEKISSNFENLVNSDNDINENSKKIYKEKKDNILNYINKNDIDELLSQNKTTEIENYSDNLKNIKETFIEIVQEYLSPDFKYTPTISSRIDKHLALMNKASNYTQ